MIRRPPRSTQSRSSAASDVYKRQVVSTQSTWGNLNLMADSLIRFDEIEKHFVEKRRFVETLVLIIQDRIELETNYASNLERISYNLGTLLDKTSLAPSLISLRSYNSIKSEQSRIIANAFKSEVIEALNKLLEKMGTELKTIQGNGRKLDKTLRGAIDRFDNMKVKYAKALKEFDDVEANNRLLQETIEVLPDKKLKSGEKSFMVMKERDAAEKLFKQQLETYNNEINSIIEEYKVILGSYRGLEQERLQIIHDCFMKSVVYEVSYIRNLQYDIERIAKKLHEFDVKKDLDEFITVKPEQLQIRKLKFEDFHDSILQSLAENRTRMSINDVRKTARDFILGGGLGSSLKSLLDFSEPNQFSMSKAVTYIEAEKAAVLDAILERVFIGTQTLEKDLEKFKNLIKLPGAKSYAIQFWYRKMDEGKNVLTEEQFERFKKFVKATLEEAVADNNFSFAHRVLIVSEMFHRPNEAGDHGEVQPKRFLYTWLLGNVLFKNVSFWEFSFFEAVNEAISRKMAEAAQKNIDPSEETIRFRIIIMNQINLCVKRMLYFEVERVDIDQFLNKLGRIFLLEKSFIDEITKIISEANYPNPDRILIEREEAEEIKKIMQNVSQINPVSLTLLAKCLKFLCRIQRRRGKRFSRQANLVGRNRRQAERREKSKHRHHLKRTVF
eukprot:TRINITY_DN2330_c0_g1_i5.p1 TRINITY_DN2330_c0_g1~~TRINITY_DN2330_c0_g1_i5.p1  ORF type:complete len:670 (+),score=169.43 TRINITY_DN2330_c0_g1_i5:19-2028(+)